MTSTDSNLTVNMDMDRPSKGECSEDDPLVHTSLPRPQLVQRRKCVGCFFIIALLMIAVVVLIGLVVGLGVGFSTKKSSPSLAEEIKGDNLMALLKDLQKIADNSTSNSRSVANGYNASAEFVFDKLRDAGYKPTRNYLEVPVYDGEVSNANFSASVPNITFSWTFLRSSQFAVMRYSDSGEVVETLQAIYGENVPVTSDPGGCSSDDFSEFMDRSVALINYTTTEECTLFEKVQNAVNANASAVVIMRDENETDYGPPTTRIYNQSAEGFQLLNIPILGATYQLGQELLELISLANWNLTVTIETATSITWHYTYNVIADTERGKNTSVVVIGSHLDSVPAGPGINDNGSGSMANLEIALQMARLKLKPKNTVRFAFWAAEELGLYGSTHYVLSLTNEEKTAIALNLNFDMLGSPNYVRMIYNGSEAAEEIRNASIKIQSLFEERFQSQSLKFNLSSFTGRSDYGPFIENGIPAGGATTGADETKSAFDRTEYGGFANAKLDTCYHQPCDTIDNIDWDVYEQMAQAAAYVLNELMMKEDLRGYLNSAEG